MKIFIGMFTVIACLALYMVLGTFIFIIVPLIWSGVFLTILIGDQKNE